MKGLFVISEALYETSGISKKIISQVNAFRNNGIEMDLTYFKVDSNDRYIGRVVNDGFIDTFSPGAFRSRVDWRIKFTNLFKYIIAGGISFVYIRYLHFANPSFNFFLKRLKQAGIRIILEVPTYPYDQEYIGSSLSIIIEKSSRKEFKKYVDYIVTFSDDDFIFNVPTIKISNGIDINTIKLVPDRIDKAQDVINMLGVASLSFWHGYDRVIEGLRDYYNSGKATKTVIFNIVADIKLPETIKCKQLVETYKLERYVIFHGKKFGKELDKIFEIADIGVGSLGRHRSGIKFIKPIKNREYCARGIPFFYSETDSDFENSRFIMKIPDNDTSLNIHNVVKFLTNNVFIPAGIREYAASNLTWDKQMSTVVKFIVTDNNIPLI